MPDIFVALIRFDSKDTWHVAAQGDDYDSLRSRLLHAKKMNPTIQVKLTLYKVDKELPL
jgi:hypothetical protein